MRQLHLVEDHGPMSVFEVGIGAGAGGKFRVDVVRSPAGEASASVRLDVPGMAGRRVQVQQALLASAITARRVPSATEQVIREVWQDLFRALLGTGEVAALYRASRAVTAERGQKLRLVVRIDSPQLAGLPWEAMYDEHLGTYVCRVGELVRHVPVPAVPAPLQVQVPLRILAVVSSPRGLPLLDADKERDQLERALARLVGAGQAEVCWAPSATWAGLQELLMDGPWHVVHYIGHGDFDPGLDEGILALERDQDGRLDRVAAHRVVDLLHQATPMPRLVVLNSCSGGTAGVYDLFSGTAASLVRGGVSAVAAMQYEISDPAAVAFARGFYARLARGGGVDEAITSGRIAILGAGDSTMEWLTPVLYLRGDQTHLYAIASAPAEDAPQLPEPRSQTQAARLLAEAERIAQSIADEDDRAAALGDVAGVLAATDPDRAERTARSITVQQTRAGALALVAGGLAATNPERAGQLAADAEHTASSITDNDDKVRSLARVAAALAATDPGRAERIAQSITDRFWRAKALLDVAEASAASDPGRASRLFSDAELFARSLHGQQQGEALLNVVKALAFIDPEDAERVARSAPEDYLSASMLTVVARALAATDPGRAGRLIADIERFAQSLPDQSRLDEMWKAQLLALVVSPLAALDPDRAERLAESISPIRREQALGYVAEAVAASDPGRAERVVQSIASERFKDAAVPRIASAMAASDPERAERLARWISINHEDRKVQVLVKIADSCRKH
jgi:hypothetical protein